ncbi:MAG: bifunctional precorrin-2 dehydrogenase/sirohydrochlorin ferrochelatase [Novosphingobium sp.]
MTNSLPLFHRIAGQPVILLGEGEAGLAKRRLIERAGGVIVGEDDRHARLAFVALDDPDATAARLKARGLLVNVTDRPDLCDFTVPSLLERGPVQLAVGTGGVSAGLAKSLRLRLEALLPQSLGELAQGLSAVRAALKTRFPDAADRRRALDAALAQGGALDPFDSESAARIAGWLENSASGGAATVEIRLRSPDPDDLTLREARFLGSADCLAVEPGVPAEIALRARADAVREEIEIGAPPPLCGGLVVVLRASSSGAITGF